MDAKYITAIIVVIIAIIALVIVGATVIGYSSTMKARYKECQQRIKPDSNSITTPEHIDDIMNNDDMTTLTSEQDKDWDYPPDDVEKTSSGWKIFALDIPRENPNTPPRDNKWIDYDKTISQEVSPYI